MYERDPGRLAELPGTEEMVEVQTARPECLAEPYRIHWQPAREGLHRECPEFNAFFSRYEQPLYGYLRRIVPCAEVALELSQEAFFRAWQHFPELQIYDRPEAWLYRVATNLAISYIRRKKSLSFAQLFRYTSDCGDPCEAGVEPEFLADSLDLEQQTAEKMMIEQTLQQLAQRQRAALVLRSVYGLSCQEISVTMGISVANVRQTLSRGRARFRKLYRSTSKPCPARTGVTPRRAGGCGVSGGGAGDL
jgi:RNA polymerase sigma-70 factor (ECF subfamily)